MLVASAQRWALIHEHRGAPEPSLDELLRHLTPCDLVLVEGFKAGGHPKLEVYRAACGQAPLAATRSEHRGAGDRHGDGRHRDGRRSRDCRSTTPKPCSTSSSQRTGLNAAIRSPPAGRSSVVIVTSGGDDSSGHGAASRLSQTGRTPAARAPSTSASGIVAHVRDLVGAQAGALAAGSRKSAGRASACRPRAPRGSPRSNASRPITAQVGIAVADREEPVRARSRSSAGRTSS